MEQIYGDQLKGVYLFGSYACGDQAVESDVDVTIILSRFNQYGEEIELTGELVSKLSLKYGLTLSRIFQRESDWKNKKTPLLRSLQGEAVRL